MNTREEDSKENWRLLMQRQEELLINATTMRREISNLLTDPRRNINAECGYPEGAVSLQTYQDLFDYEGIATRVVEVMPKESFKIQPDIYEDEDPEITTPFEEAVYSLPQFLSNEENYHEYEKGNPIWETLSRIDCLSGIGQYGVLLIGIDDGKDLSTPAEGYEDSGERNFIYNLSAVNPSPSLSAASATASSTPLRKLIYLSTFPETLAPIASFETRENHPRYGLPTSYSITLSDPRMSGVGGTNVPTSTRTVHWSRCIHIADNISTSRTFGVPRMQSNVRRLLDLQKLHGGSAEMYYKGAFPGLSIETIPQLGGNVKIDKARLKDMMEEYMNGLQRYLAFTGMSAKTLSPQVVDPTPQIQVQIDAICIQKGIPKRIFMGSERGQLASDQDDEAWNERIDERRINYVTPCIICPFFNRLIGLKVLPPPKKKYKVYWPGSASQSESQKANIAVQKSIALANYSSGQSDAFVPPKQFLFRFLDIPEKDAVAIVDEAKAYKAEKDEEEMTLAKKRIDAGVEKDPNAPIPVKAQGANGAKDAPRGGIAKPAQS